MGVEIADYLLDNYGECKLANCICLRDGWRGRLCRNWQPCGATSWDELRRIYTDMRNTDTP